MLAYNRPMLIQLQGVYFLLRISYQHRPRWVAILSVQNLSLCYLMLSFNENIWGIILLDLIINDHVRISNESLNKLTQFFYSSLELVMD